MTSAPHFGLTGLAVMGANLARNVAHHFADAGSFHTRWGQDGQEIRTDA